MINTAVFSIRGKNKETQRREKSQRERNMSRQNAINIQKNMFKWDLHLRVVKTYANEVHSLGKLGNTFCNLIQSLDNNLPS